MKRKLLVIINIDYNLAVNSQGGLLRVKIKNQKAAGQYQCEADNGIDEKQSKLIVVNVNGMKLYSFMNFAL